MASLRVLAFDHEGRPVQFDTWLDDLQLYLLSNSKDSVSLFDHTSGAATAPPATANSSTRSQWLTRDAAARLAIRNHLPLAECAHFGQHRTAQALNDAVVARYSSPATDALGRLLLPYQFPELSAFTTIEDLVSHLRASEARYRAAVPAKDHSLSLHPTSLTVDLLEQHLLAAETNAVAVGAARGTPRPPFFEGCSPSPLAPSCASTEAADVSASASAKFRSSKGKGGLGGGGGIGGGGGGSGSGGGGSGGRGGAVEVVAAVGLLAGLGDLVAVVEAAMGVAAVEAVGQVAVGLALAVSVLGVASVSNSNVGARPRLSSSFTCRRLHTQHRCLSRLDDAWRAEFGDDFELPRRADLLKSRIAIFDLDFDAILSTMYALSVSAEGDCYKCVPPDLGIAAAALGASESGTLPGTTSAQALHTFYWTPVPRAPSQVAASAQVSASDQVAATCSCRLLLHQTLLWHHRLGHPSLPRLRGMHSRLLVSGLPRSLPPLPPLPAPPCLPCVEGRQRAAPHSSSFPPTTAPLQTLHMDVWGPAHVSEQSRERYFLLVVDDYMRYTTVFPLRSKGQFVDVLIPWIRTVRLQLLKRFCFDLPVLRLHSDRGGEFSSTLLRDFCHGEGILQSFTLLGSPQQNGIAECRIGLVMEVARTSMIHAAAPHFLWPFAVQYAAHQLNLCPRVSLQETSPTLRWTGKVDDASVFRVWGSRAFVRDTSADKLSPRAIPCVLSLALSPTRLAGSFTTPPRAVSSPLRTSHPLPSPVPVQVAVDSGAARGTTSRGAESEGAETGGAEPGGVETGGAEPGGVAIGGGAAGAGGTGVAAGAGVTGGSATTGPGGARTRGTGAGGTGDIEGAGAGDLTESGNAGAGGPGVGGAGAGGAGAVDPGAGGSDIGGAGDGGAGAVLGTPPSAALTPPLLCPPPDQSQPPLQPASPLPAPSHYTKQSGNLTEHREPASHPVSPDRTARRVPRSHPPPVPGTHAMTLRPSSVPLRVPLPAPPESSFPEVLDPESDLARVASPIVSRLLASAVTDPSFESAAASALVAELLDFAAACRLDFTTTLIAELEKQNQRLFTNLPPAVLSSQANAVRAATLQWQNISQGNLALLKALRVSFDIASAQLNLIDGLHGTLRNVQGTLAVLTKSLLIPLSTNSDPRIGAAMAGNTSAGAGDSSAQDRSGSHDSGVSAPRGARTNQGSLIKEVLKNFTVEKFNGVDRAEGAPRPDFRCRNVDAGEGAVRVALERGRAGATCFGQNARPLHEVGDRGNHLPGADQVLEDAIAAAGIVASIHERIEPAAEPELVDARVGADEDSGGGLPSPPTEGWRRRQQRLCKGADVAEDVASVVLDAVQRRTTTPTTNKEVPVGVAVRNLDVGASRNRHRDGGARRNQKNGANMVADLSDNHPKNNGGAEKKKERTAGQFFHIGEQGEQGDASAKVGAELHLLDYWVLDTGAAWTMTPRKELLHDVRATPINEVCSASGHALKVAGAGRAAFKGADGKPVVLHDVLLVLDIKANLISLRKLAKAGVSTSTDGARTYKGQLGNRVLWDAREQGCVQIHVAAAGVGVARWGAGWRGVCIPGGLQRRWRGWCEGVGQIWGDRLGNGTPTLGACGNALVEAARDGWTVTGKSKKPLELVHMEEALGGPDREKIKTDDKGQVIIYKSRLVAKGFMQKEKKDFNEIFAPTAKPPTLRVLLADAAVSGKSIIQMDISTTFLNRILEEDVYMTQPPGYEDGTGRVCKLEMSIYGLKQAPRCWYQKLAAVLEEMGFRTSSCD
ncbi:unnamed protein product [Closterium sp. NIES-53]